MMLSKVQRNLANTTYSAQILHRGEIIGTVKKRRGAIDYIAVVGGEMVARGRTLEELKTDLRAYLSEDVTPA